MLLDVSLCQIDIWPHSPQPVLLSLRLPFLKSRPFNNFSKNKPSSLCLMNYTFCLKSKEFLLENDKSFHCSLPEAQGLNVKSMTPCELTLYTAQDVRCSSPTELPLYLHFKIKYMLACLYTQPTLSTYMWPFFLQYLIMIMAAWQQVVNSVLWALNCVLCQNHWTITSSFTFLFTFFNLFIIIWVTQKVYCAFD